MIDTAVVDWLLDSDPSLRWQVEYPYRAWHSGLKAVDYVTEAALHDGVRPDPRAHEAVELLRSARPGDGRWVQEIRYEGRVWFDIDVPAGEPSRWVTFLAERALARWDALA